MSVLNNYSNSLYYHSGLPICLLLLIQGVVRLQQEVASAGSGSHKDLMINVLLVTLSPAES
jgi:hypothetical protein